MRLGRQIAPKSRQENQRAQTFALESLKDTRARNKTDFACPRPPLRLSSLAVDRTPHLDYGHPRPPYHAAAAAAITMFKPTQALCRRYRKLPLTTKDINKGFYKGTRSGRMGNHDKWGGYQVDFSLVRSYVVPDLQGFKVREEEKPRTTTSKLVGAIGPSLTLKK